MPILATSMTTLLAVSGLFAIIALVVGFGAGWWIFSGKKQEDSKQSSVEQDRAFMAAAQIQDLTNRVLQDVDMHSTAMEQVSADLAAVAGDADSEKSKAIARALENIFAANESLKEQLARAEKKLEEQAAEIATQQSAAMTDCLTGLNNRRAFDEEMKRRYSEWERKGTPFSMMIFDIDHFKKFNDTHGHQAGDEVLRRVGKAIQEITRQMDIPCRYGGEEFAVIMPSTTDNDAKKAAERARRGIEKLLIAFEGKKLKVTASVGLAEIMKQDDTALLLRRADDALYVSKEAGRNCGHFHDGKTFIPLTPGKGIAANKRATSKPLPKIEMLGRIVKEPAFEAEVTRRVAESHRFGVPLSIAVVTLENYATVAAKDGADVADVALDAVAQFLQSTIRDMDLLSRRGENAFAIMLPGSTEKEASLVTGRIMAALANCIVPAGSKKVKVDVTTTLASLGPGQAAEDFIAAAISGNATIEDNSKPQESHKTDSVL